MALLLAGCVVLAGCAGVQTPLAPAGDQASALHQLMVLMFVVCGAVFLAVLAGLAWTLLRARHNTIDGRDGDARLNRGVWVAASAITVGLTVLIVGSFLADRALFATRGADALEVRVTGHQWWWRIEYRDPVRGRWIKTANELHLPLGRVTRVSLGSADVIHSFWVPNVSGKIDMIPGRKNTLDLTPRRPGWFRGQCS